MVMDPVTMNKARDEAGAYDFRKISKDHYAVYHDSKMYVIIERDGKIGCSCDDMTFNRMDGSVCKHLIAFSRLMSPIDKEIDEMEKSHLMHVCGWTGKELHPEIELGGPGAVVQEDKTPTPKDSIPPDPELDIGVDDQLPEPEKPSKITVKCQWCKMGATRKDQKAADAWLKKHEANCPNNPANNTTSYPKGESNEGEDPVPPGAKPPKPRQVTQEVPEQEPEQKSEEEQKMEETITNTQTEVQTTEPQRGFLTAAVSLDDAIKAFNLYGQAKTRLLNDNDVLYIGASGKPVHKDVKDSVPYIKKSGWRKMARFFGLSVDILGREKMWTEDAKGDKYYIWAYTIKVSHQCGAYVLAEGVCSSRDKFFTKGGKVPADETNVMLKAQTVGINRGISDLLGAGEVSAEEVE
ncbi:MAG: hypothetical protein BA874_06665 [Desulfuromonadales bacterium C00003068]|nr:MAG: hypothetical protein BA874_06665 [Desulfuromonadales bacterium C00003068]